jgi:hypothetical protein
LAEVFQETGRLVSHHTGFLAGVFAAIAGGYLAIDLMGMQIGDASGMLLPASIFGLVVTFFVQYVVTERLLIDRRFEGQPALTRRYGSLFVASLLSGAAIGIGTLFLVVPGIYLAGRWFTYSAHLIEKSLGASESLNASWADSANSQLAFSLAALLGFSPTVLLFGVGYLSGSGLLESDSIWALTMTNVVTTLTAVLSWTLGIAAYRLAVPTDTSLGAVFD